MPAVTFVYWNYQDSSGIKVNSSWYFWQYRPLGQIHLLNALGQEKSKTLEAAHIAEQKALPCHSLARKLSKDSDAVPEALSCLVHHSSICARETWNFWGSPVALFYYSVFRQLDDMNFEMEFVTHVELTFFPRLVLLEGTI